GALGEGDLLQGVERQTLDARTEQPRADDDPAVGYAVDRLAALKRIGEEPADDHVESDQDERDTPEGEEEGRAEDDHHRFPENRETAPDQAERDREGIRRLEPDAAAWFATPEESLVRQQEWADRVDAAIHGESPSGSGTRPVLQCGAGSTGQQN